MKRAVMLVSFVIASVCSGQEWRFALSSSVLSPESPSVTVSASIDEGPTAWAFANAILAIDATEPGWGSPRALITHPGQFPGEIVGASVQDIVVGQLLSFGPGPQPGRIYVWQATFTVTDFTPRRIDLSTDTERLQVWLDTFWERESRIAVEGAASIQVVPAPAGLTLLGLAGLAAARRRRSERAPCRRTLQ